MDTDKEINEEGGIYHECAYYGLLNPYLTKELNETTRNLNLVGRRSIRNTGNVSAVNNSEGIGDEDKLKTKLFGLFLSVSADHFFLLVIGRGIRFVL